MKKHHRKPLRSKNAQIYTGKKSGRTFEIREVTAAEKWAEKAAVQVVKNRDKFAASLADSVLRIIFDFNPANQVELSEQLGARLVLNKVRFDRAKYLARGKTIPEWPGSLEYQHRVAAALILILEPPYVIHDRKKASRPQAAKARRKHKQRR